jgi:ATP-binding cassette subfamily B protein RaxB
MLLAYHGQPSELRSLRERWGSSAKGTSLRSLIATARELGLVARPLRVEPADLAELQLPCVLHWNFDHFVVLSRIDRAGLEILDPSGSKSIVRPKEVDRKFTGIAIEMSPMGERQQIAPTRKLRLLDLTKGLEGLPIAIASVLALTLASQAALVMLPLFSRAVVDKPLMQNLMSLLPFLAVAWLVVACTQVALDAARNLVSFRMNQHYALRSRIRTFDHLLSLPMPFFQRRGVADVQSRFRSLDELLQVISDGAPVAILDGVFCIAGLGMLAFLNWQLAVVAGTTLLVAGFVVTRTIPSQNRALERVAIALNAEVSLVYETIRGMQTIKLLSAEARRLSQYGLLAEETAAAQSAQVRMLQTNTSITVLARACCEIVAMSVGAFLVVRQGMTIGTLIGFIAFMHLVLTRFQIALVAFTRYRNAAVNLDRVADILCALPEEDRPAPWRGAESECAIKVEGLHFAYAPTEQEVLSAINFSVRRGECIALRGSSGCGKTTLIKLMAALLKPTAGDIVVFGDSLASTSLSAYRTAIAAVMQDDELFAGSLLDNIVYPEVIPDLDRVDEVLELAKLSKDIKALPLGLLTRLGDMGSVLSAGQKQRVLLARAFYRRPRILFLDEPTADLDLDTERKVVDEIGKLECTRVVVTHRPDILRIADRIGEFRDGKIVWESSQGVFQNSERRC